MNATPVDDLAAALDIVSALVARVREDQWSAATPCSEWNVRELVNHLTLGDRLVGDVVRGGAGLAPDALDPKAADVLGDDPVASHRRAARALQVAFRQPGVLEEVFQLPVGPVPGVVAVHVRTVEAVVHGWDIAQATGQEIAFADDFVERERAFIEDVLTQLPAEGSPFGPPQPVAEDSPPLNHLVALLGRGSPGA